MPDRNNIYDSIEESVSATPPARKDLKSYLLDLDLSLCAAKLVYYDSQQESAEVLKFIHSLAQACVLAMEEHGLPDNRE